MDFSNQQINVRDGKGTKDRTTMLPGKTIPTLQAHLEIVNAIHKKDLLDNYGSVTIWDDRTTHSCYVEADITFHAFGLKRIVIDLLCILTHTITK